MKNKAGEGLELLLLLKIFELKEILWKLSQKFNKGSMRQ